MWGHRKWKWKHGTSKKEGKKEKVTTVNMVFIFLIYLYLSEFRLVWLRWSEIVIKVKRGQKGDKWKLLNIGNKKDKNRRQAGKKTISLFLIPREKQKPMKGWGKRIFVMTWFEQFVFIFISKTSVSLVDLPFLWQAFEGIVLVVWRPSGQLGKNKLKAGL